MQIDWINSLPGLWLSPIARRFHDSWPLICFILPLFLNNGVMELFVHDAGISFLYQQSDRIRFLCFDFYIGRTFTVFHVRKRALEFVSSDMGLIDVRDFGLLEFFITGWGPMSKAYLISTEIFRNSLFCTGVVTIERLTSSFQGRIGFWSFSMAKIRSDHFHKIQNCRFFGTGRFELDGTARAE